MENTMDEKQYEISEGQVVEVTHTQVKTPISSQEIKDQIQVHKDIIANLQETLSQIEDLEEQLPEEEV